MQNFFKIIKHLSIASPCDKIDFNVHIFLYLNFNTLKHGKKA